MHDSRGIIDGLNSATSVSSRKIRKIIRNSREKGSRAQTFFCKRV
jgi:hypothetical protein